MGIWLGGGQSVAKWEASSMDKGYCIYPKTGGWTRANLSGKFTGGGGIFLLVCRCIIFFVLVFVLVGHMCNGEFFLVEKKQKGTMVDSKKHQFPLEDEERTGKNFTSYKASFWVSSVQMHVHIGANLMCDSSTYIYSTNIHPPWN